MLNTEIDYEAYEAENDREDAELRRREREDETNPVTDAVNGWLASQTIRRAE